MIESDTARVARNPPTAGGRREPTGAPWMPAGHAPPREHRQRERRARSHRRRLRSGGCARVTASDPHADAATSVRMAEPRGQAVARRLSPACAAAGSSDVRTASRFASRIAGQSHLARDSQPASPGRIACVHGGVEGAADPLSLRQVRQANVTSPSWGGHTCASAPLARPIAARSQDGQRSGVALRKGP